MYDLYAIYKQAHPPSSVEHCLVCKFTSPNENNLVITGVSFIRVFRLVDEKNTNNENGVQEFQESQEVTKKKKLELVGQYSLFGLIKSMKAVRLSGNIRDSLLLSFDDAKLSIVEYDPGTHDLKTISLHYFEEEELKGGTRLHFNDPTVRIDPDNRCAAMWIYSHWLVILPFRQDGALEEHEPGVTKPQVLPSYTILMRDIDSRLSNIIDIQFLHGYYEPTLLILYEPLKTWPGRLAVRQDTCSLVAISVNLTEKVNPVIWSVEQLPFDCAQVLPIPRPIGGVLLFATNSLLYLNQSVPAYGVSLNSIGDSKTSFPFRQQEGVAITLDSAHASFISNDRLVVSLKGGEIYVLTLVTDTGSVKSVRSFNFEKAAASVQTSCICPCEDGYLFLGSRLGNSLLLKYTEKVHELFPNGVNPTIPKEGLPPHMKRRKLDSEYMHGLDDLDELEVYGANTKGTQLASYSFEVCDSLINIGPCSSVDMSEPAFLSEEFTESSFPDMELVICSGYGKNGALSVLQKSVRPQVVTTFELPGCVDMWTVTSREPEDTTNATQQRKPQRHHSFLILSRKDSSMVLRTEQEIMELDHSGFSTQYPTVCAANLGEGRYILQVTPMGVRLLDGIKQIQHIPMDAGFSSIIWCSVADPYAIMLTADGTLMLLTFTWDNNATPSLTVSRVQIDQWSVVCACCCYKDVSGMFTTEKSCEPPTTEEIKKPIYPETFKPEPSHAPDADDEEELLYGDTDISDVFTNSSTVSQPSQSTVNPAAVDNKEAKLTYWCVLCRENGALEIYTVPDFKLVFCVRNFAVAPKVLVDSGATGSGGSSQNQDNNLVVKEVLLTNFQKPLLAAIVGQDLLLYEAFNFTESANEGHLNIRFKKLQHSVLMREKQSKVNTTKLSTSDEGIDNIPEPVVGRLRAFHDIASYSGIFVCGSYPYWLFMTSRNTLRTHPMNIDGSVSSFAPFHNVNCPKGFLYFNKKGELRVSVLPAHLTYDAPWPVRKIPLRCTPHSVAYNRESKTHAIVSSQMEPVKVITRLGLEDREFHPTEDDPRFVYPFLDKFCLQLISPVSWEIIPSTKFDLEDYERVTTMKNITLTSEETVSGMKGFICLGTTYVYGEDLPCKGRILIFDIIEVVPEPGQPLTKNKFKVLYDKEQKGPVTALAEVRGFLLTAIGQKIYIWDFKKSNDLVGVAFIDTQLYIHTAISVKNLVFIADISKSVTLLRFQESTKTLAFVARDQNPLEVYGTEFFVDGSQLGFLVSDNDMNLVVYRYQPEDPASHGGQKLLHTADINISSCVTSFFRCRVKTEKTGNEKAKDLRQASWFGTLDGGLGLLLPMPEKTFRRLHMVQNMLMHSIPHYAGLNPKAFRLLRWRHRPLDNPQHHILDFELLSKFVHLGVVERLEVTRKIGVAPEQILDDLMEIDKLTAHF